MVKSFGFVLNVIIKLFYAILASVKFQWVFYISMIGEHTIHAEHREDVFIDDFGVWFIDYGLWYMVYGLSMFVPFTGLWTDSKSTYIMNGTLD